MYTAVILHCLGNGDKKKICICSVQAQHFSIILDLQLADPTNVEPQIRRTYCTCVIKMHVTY
jgi:hypothetical protein